jgi:hypothetical protein
MIAARRLTATLLRLHKPVSLTSQRFFAGDAKDVTLTEEEEKELAIKEEKEMMELTASNHRKLGSWETSALSILKRDIEKAYPSAPSGEVTSLHGFPEEVLKRTVLIRANVPTLTMDNHNVCGFSLTWTTETTGSWTNPLTGWASSGDAMGDVQLNFDTIDEATRYCDNMGLKYEICGNTNAKKRTFKTKGPHSYEDNFLQPKEKNFMKKHGARGATQLWKFASPGKSYWTNPKRSDYGSDKWDKKNTPTFA